MRNRLICISLIVCGALHTNCFAMDTSAKDTSILLFRNDCDSTEWVNFRKIYPDSCMKIIPFLQKIPIREKGSIFKETSHFVTIKDTSLLVPWSSIRDLNPFPSSWFPGKSLFNAYMLDVTRLIDRCLICNSRLLSFKFHIPYTLFSRLIPDGHLIYCENCRKQVGVVDGVNQFKRINKVQPPPKWMVGFWECQKDYHIWTTRRPQRIIMQIQEDGIVKYWSQKLSWNTSKFSPKAMWINGGFSTVRSNYLSIDKRTMYLFDSETVSINYIKGTFGKTMTLTEKGRVRSTNSTPIVTKEPWYMNKDRFRKITTPYSVFPYVPIGEWPSEKLWKNKQFTLPIKKVIQLTETAISDGSRHKIDSLKIELVTIPIFRDSTSIDLNLLFDALNIIHDSEISGNQVLVVCDSHQYLLSKLLGECYHFQKMREIVKRNDFELLDKYSSALECFSEEGYLPPLAEMKKILRKRKPKRNSSVSPLDMNKN